jgi:hypothetical protein
MDSTPRTSIIFLDIDGVLVTPASMMRRNIAGNSSVPDSVHALNHLLVETGALLVVTSTWRLEYSLDELSDLFQAWGIQAGIQGITPSASSRSEEIHAWLDEFSRFTPVDAFVILDDMEDMGDLSSHLICTESKVGLTMRHAEQARDLLTMRSESNQS